MKRTGTELKNKMSRQERREARLRQEKLRLQKKSKLTLIVYAVIRLIVVGVLVRSAFNGQIESVYTCLLTLVLLLLPSILERKLGALCRKAAMAIVSNGVKSIHITGDNLEDYLGIRRYHPERLPRTEQVGVVNGLAWTQVGGEILEVEVGVVPGSGKVELTGNLGSVMKESAQAALSYIRSRAAQLGIEADFYKTKDIHVHFPEGAVPKDGPSAGIAITTAMVSALTGAPVRREIAMTGEVTLRGRVLPIGGLKEKTMAAYRSGIKTVFLPADNVPDLEEIDPTVRAALHFVPVEQVDSVLAEALELKTCDPLRDDALPPPESGSRSREVPTFRQ